MEKEAMLWEALEDGKVSCFLCAHHCKISTDNYGFCGVRQNIEGKLFTHAYGEVIAAHVDPIEKKPLYHFLPGSLSFSIAAAGCNFRCGFCQNWQISQITKKESKELSGQRLAPAEIVKQAQKNQCKSISYTYTEPTIFFEYACDAARLAREQGLYNVFVTNGYMTSEALETIRPWLDACNVDLKSFSDDFYRKTCRGRLEPVLSSIRLMKEMGIWVEATTLLIPGHNDGEDEVRKIAGFLAGVDPDIPWHISRFHANYQFVDTASTPLGTLRRARAIGIEEGLRFIYIGNVPGEKEDTACPECGEEVVRRHGFFVKSTSLQGSECPRCGKTIAGVFS